MNDLPELFHAGTYDPQKAHEYYLRTRKLKGKLASARAAPAPRVGRPSSTTAVRTGGKPNRADTKSRQAQLKAQKEHLEARMEKLRQVLESLVEAAKKRSGGDPNKKDKKDAPGTAPETKVDKADRNKAEKAAKPLTAKQKADKAKQAKETYEKEHPNTLSQDVDILQEQVKDIQAKIQTALAAARDRMQKEAGQKDSKSGSKNDQPSGPQGR